MNGNGKGWSLEEWLVLNFSIALGDGNGISWAQQSELEMFHQVIDRAMTTCICMKYFKPRHPLCL